MSCWSSCGPASWPGRGRFLSRFTSSRLGKGTRQKVWEGGGEVSTIPVQPFRGCGYGLFGGRLIWNSPFAAMHIPLGFSGPCVCICELNEIVLALRNAPPTLGCLCAVGPASSLSWLTSWLIDDGLFSNLRSQCLAPLWSPPSWGTLVRARRSSTRVRKERASYVVYGAWLRPPPLPPFLLRRYFFLDVALVLWAANVGLLWWVRRLPLVSLT